MKITMDDFQVYRYYIALKLHFFSDGYDIFKYKGRTTVTRSTFEKRKDKAMIHKLAKKFSDKEVVDFLVANLVSGDRWGGIFDSMAEDVYNEWRKRIESISYYFDKDLSYLQFEMEKQNKSFDDVFTCEDGQHPFLLRAYLGKKISIETLILLDNCRQFKTHLDNQLNNDMMWKEVSKLFTKYKPFITYDKEAIYDTYRKRFGSQAEED